MTRLVVLLVAVVLSGCGGGDAEEPSGGVGTAVVLSRCANVGRVGERTYTLCYDANGVDRAFFVEDGGETRQLDVRSPGIAGVGHWSWAALSPDGSNLLAQWIAECEVPVAYFVAVERGKPRPVVGPAVESIALGWTSDGAARVALPKGVCGQSAARSGVYAVGLDGQKRFLRPFDPARDKIRS